MEHGFPDSRALIVSSAYLHFARQDEASFLHDFRLAGEDEC